MKITTKDISSVTKGISISTFSDIFGEPNKPIDHVFLLSTSLNKCPKISYNRSNTGMMLGDIQWVKDYI